MPSNDEKYLAKKAREKRAVEALENSPPGTPVAEQFKETMGLLFPEQRRQAAR